MRQFLFGKLLLGILGMIVMGKIYQHNHVIQASYTKQRLETGRRKLLKERDALMIQLAELTDYKTVKQFAQKELLMEPLPLSRVITFTVKL